MKNCNTISLSNCVALLRGKRILVMLLIAALQGCASFSPNADKHGVLISAAVKPEPTQTQKVLSSLPKPVGKVVTAVYGFRDLTGQNKPTPSSGLSTAVTQGASNILIKSLLDSGWFQPVERYGLQNLLTERNLWNQKLGNAKLLPLPPASVIIEGGIIGYDFNVRTGGAGAKYLGIGGSKTYREDTVTINIRVVNAKDGSILHSIDSSKSVYSQSINTSAFGFATFDQLLELESGYAFNEPIFESVKEAINSALVNLIAEGVLRSTWKLAQPTDIDHKAFDKYLSDTEREAYTSKNKPVIEKLSVPDPSFAPDIGDLPLPKVVSPVADVSKEKGQASQLAVVQSLSNVVDEEASFVELKALSPKQVAELDQDLQVRERQSKEYLFNARKEEQEYQRMIATKREKKQLVNSIPVESSNISAENESVTSIASVSEVEARKPEEEKTVKSVSLLVGQFSTRAEALNFRSEIAEKLTDVDASVATNPEKTSFKVAIGPLLNQLEIDSVVSHLRESGIEQVQVIKNY